MKMSKNAWKHVLHTCLGRTPAYYFSHTHNPALNNVSKRGVSFRWGVWNMWQVIGDYGKKFKCHFSLKCIICSYLNVVSITKVVISSTLTTLTSQRMPSCTSKRYTERLHVFWEVDWKRMKHWQDQSWFYVSAVQKWASGAVYFTVIIPTIITTPQNNDFLHWRRSEWRGFYNRGK